MRKLKQISVAAVLALVFSAGAMAGTIDTPPSPAPGTIDTPPSQSNLAVSVAVSLVQLAVSGR